MIAHKLCAYFPFLKKIKHIIVILFIHLYLLQSGLIDLITPEKAYQFKMLNIGAQKFKLIFHGYLSQYSHFLNVIYWFQK